MENVLNVTSIEELKRVSSGEIVSLPPFVEGSEFNARLKRPSMLAMAKSGRIPNELLVSANELFTNGINKTAVNNISDSNLMTEMINILEMFCEDAFVEPTYNQLKENGIQLTDEQMFAVFQYAQAGVESLKSFRK